VGLVAPLTRRSARSFAARVGLAFSMIANVGESPVISLRIVPAIFTTAELWTTDVDLSTADLATGKLGTDLKAQQVDWIWLNYNRSENLRPVLQHPTNNFGVDVLSGRMPAEFTRSIAAICSNLRRRYQEGTPCPPSSDPPPADTCEASVPRRSEPTARSPTTPPPTWHSLRAE